MIFCDTCGTKIANQAPPPPQNYSAPPPQNSAALPSQNYSTPPNNSQYPRQNYTPPAPQKKKSSGGTIAVIVLVVAIVIGILYWVGASSEDPYTPPPSTPDTNNIPPNNQDVPPNNPSAAWNMTFNNLTGYTIDALFFSYSTDTEWGFSWLNEPLPHDHWITFDNMPSDGMSAYLSWDLRVDFAGQSFEWYEIDAFNNREIIIYVTPDGVVEITTP